MPACDRHIDMQPGQESVWGLLINLQTRIHFSAVSLLGKIWEKYLQNFLNNNKKINFVWVSQLVKVKSETTGVEFINWKLTHNSSILNTEHHNCTAGGRVKPVPQTVMGGWWRARKYLTTYFRRVYPSAELIPLAGTWQWVAVLQALSVSHQWQEGKRDEEMCSKSWREVNNGWSFRCAGRSSIKLRHSISHTGMEFNNVHKQSRLMWG